VLIPHQAMTVSPLFLSVKQCAYRLKVFSIIRPVEDRMKGSLIDQISLLANAASNHPYYKFNSWWSRQMQDAVRFNAWKPCTVAEVT